VSTVAVGLKSEAFAGGTFSSVPVNVAGDKQTNWVVTIACIESCRAVGSGSTFSTEDPAKASTTPSIAQPLNKKYSKGKKAVIFPPEP
jgi:hypothetical protein